MIGKSNTAKVCALVGKAVETAALWKPWKNQKAVFPPFRHRLENSPQKARVEFSTVPTASAAEFLSEKETSENRRIPRGPIATGSKAQGSGLSGIQAGCQENVIAAGPGKVFP